VIKYVPTIPIRYWCVFILSLIAPALLINLGSLAFIEDESIRAIVAIEMLDSGNFIAPTINGDPYYSKPPLYNWFIGFSYLIFNQASEWTSRIPTVVFLILFCCLIYRVSIPYLGKAFSIFNACIFLTCGRILFYDSFLGLIDIGYSFVTYLSIMVLFLYKNQRYKQVLFSFGLTAIGYLMKGFPSLLFLGISFGLYSIWQWNKKKVLHPSIILGLLLLTSVIVGYYLLLSQYQNVENALGPLLDQSTRRTIIKYPIQKVILHIFSYPFENIFHFLPWSFLTLFIVNLKKLKFEIFNDDFMLFNGLMFLGNIIPYWISPEVYARYILMLAPFYFSFFLLLCKKHMDENTPLWKYFTFILKLTLLLIPIGIASSYFSSEIRTVSNHQVTIFIFGISTFIIGLFAIKNHKSLIPGLIAVALITRIFFDVLIIPSRVKNDYGSIIRTETTRIQQSYEPLYIYKNGRMDRSSSFYLAAANIKANQRAQKLKPNNYYILDTFQLECIESYKIIDSFPIREFRRTAFIIEKD